MLVVDNAGVWLQSGQNSLGLPHVRTESAQSELFDLHAEGVVLVSGPV